MMLNTRGLTINAHAMLKKNMFTGIGNLNSTIIVIGTYKQTIFIHTLHIYSTICLRILICNVRNKIAESLSQNSNQILYPLKYIIVTFNLFIYFFAYTFR